MRIPPCFFTFRPADTFLVELPTLICYTVGNGAPVTLDTEQRVAIRDGETVELTAKEYDLIELLMKNPRRVYSQHHHRQQHCQVAGADFQLQGNPTL